VGLEESIDLLIRESQIFLVFQSILGLPVRLAINMRSDPIVFVQLPLQIVSPLA